MNIVIIQEAGRHEKNKNFRESLCLENGFNKIKGVNAKVWGLNYPDFRPFSEIEKWADVIFIIENYTSSWIPVADIQKSKKIKVFWSIDSHCVLDQHRNLCNILKIDILLNSTDDYIKFFKGIVKESHWFPNAYPDNLIDDSRIEKTVDVGFCGNILNRENWLKYLEKYNIKKDVFIIGDDMVKAIKSYKIHFNRNISNDINYRTFETTGCGTLLLTNYTPNLEKLFKIDEEILVYKDGNDLDRKIIEALNDPDYRKSIEDAGYKRAKSDHTYSKRCEQAFDIFQKV